MVITSAGVTSGTWWRTTHDMDQVFYLGASMSMISMFGAGIAWGVYSLRGKKSGDPASATAGNFLRAVPMAAVLSLSLLPWANLDRAGIGYAIVSGAIASGVGYAIWYTALPSLQGASAASVQLIVPVLAAAGGILFLGEAITLRFLVASVAVLGGIALVVIERERNLGTATKPPAP